MKNFTFNTTKQVNLIKTRQDARRISKLVAAAFPSVKCTGADKKRDNGWSFDVACKDQGEGNKRLQRKMVKQSKQTFEVVNGVVLVN